MYTTKYDKKYKKTANKTMTYWHLQFHSFYGVYRCGGFLTLVDRRGAGLDGGVIFVVSTADGVGSDTISSGCTKDCDVCEAR